MEPDDNTLKTYIPRANGDTTKSNHDNLTKSMRSINIKVVATLGNDDLEKKPLPAVDIARGTDEVLEHQKITWKNISFMFDWIALVFFTLASLISFSLFIIITST